MFSFLYHSQPVIQHSSTIPYTLLFHGIADMDTFWYNFQWLLFHNAYFAQVLQINILCSKEYISHTHHPPTVYDSQYDWTHISCVCGNKKNVD